MDRQARTLIAVAFLTLAAFLSADLLVQRAPLHNWLLPGILTVIGLLFVWLSVRPERELSTGDEWAEAALAPALAEGGQAAAALSVPPLEASAETAAPETGDDLTMIDGIGPKTAEALKAAGVTTFVALGEMKPEAIAEALRKEGGRPGGNLDTWPQQARFAARGDWSGMRRYVSSLKADHTDDLLVLDGIGPKIAEALKAAGVGTFAAVSEKTPGELRALLDGAGVAVVGDSIETWPRQAKFAAEEDWPAMMRYIAETKKAAGGEG